ncbi:MAG: glycosyltransferase family 1 protein [Nitrospiraceae bacterium]|nr:glycosyltransferase family 1 protein [Nitrospiraceae bacterium]
MNIAIDAFSLSEKASSGISNYLKNMASVIMERDRHNNYFLYTRNSFDFSSYANCMLRCADTFGEASGSHRNTLWLFSKGVQLMVKDKIDVFWAARQMLPPYVPAAIKKVLTVYDLVWYYYPETMNRYNRLVSKLIFKKSIDKADHIITISKASADALREVLNVPDNKITIAYPAADRFAPLDKVASSEFIAQKYGANKNYALTVSTVEPRKNLGTLLRAFSGQKIPDIQLLIAGASGWKTTSIYSEYRNFGLSEERIKFLGYVPDEDMNRLYSGAQLFVFPSIYEGFGMPPLEAMASGTPVIASNSSSLPEIAEGSGILLDPCDVDAWRDAILTVMSDESLQDAMIKKGLKKAKLFSWEKSAEQILNIFEKFS